MSLFKNQDDHSSSWKEKYFRLLDNQDQFEKNQQAQEDLLCKIIVRFSLAAKGLDKTLDPHLDRIRSVLRAGVKSQQLKQELEVFSNALLSMEDASVGNRRDAEILFEFILQFYPELSNQINEIRLRYESGELTDQQGLFLTLSELIEIKSGGGDRLSDGLDLVECEAVTKHLIRLLETVELPSGFVEDGKQLKSRLQNGQAFGTVFEDAVTLLLAVKMHLQSEQQAMAEFLSTLTEELAELGMRAAGVDIAQQDALHKRVSLDNDVAAQMDDLQRTSASATALEPLKQLVNLRLRKITQQIQAHNLQEQLERDKNQNELMGLVQKIKDMESETVELKSRLEVAQERATRDPLTQLPNRLAFEERLTDELARVHRFALPLTMAVWDIDFFKNINDSFGHKSGDKALVIIAKLLNSYCRETDFVARVGGEEFVMLLPDTHGQSAMIVVNKLREVVEKSSFNANGKKISITLSCGVTEYIEGDTNESLFVRADGALYQAKQSGRNQCVLV